MTFDNRFFELFAPDTCLSYRKPELGRNGLLDEFSCVSDIRDGLKQGSFDRKFYAGYGGDSPGRVQRRKVPENHFFRNIQSLRNGKSGAVRRPQCIKMCKSAPANSKHAQQVNCLFIDWFITYTRKNSEIKQFDVV